MKSLQGAWIAFKSAVSFVNLSIVPKDREIHRERERERERDRERERERE